MTDGSWSRMEELFNRVVDLPEAERLEALERGAAGDIELREAVARLLRAHEREASRVRGVIDRAVRADPAPFGRAGEQVGPYALVRVLGEGGMGSVYLARRSDDVYAAEVAVKVLKAGAVDGDAARRFRKERHILAELNHPGIARLLDGGMTEDGAPYLVMEYVDGPTLDAYCAQQALSTRSVLELFRKVCDAVQYAHARLVVHRDLKPANILVQANGQPKLLDFGIAKLLADDAPEGDPGLTRTGLRPMTPSYASPEQVRGAPVTTATDVYALGVLLYELLTGVLPYPEGSVDSRALEDAILGHTPAAPSLALTTRDGARPTSGGSREASARHLRGDLDTIVLKTLQKDPGRRYGSVEQLSEDLGRHLSGLPVRARPDTLGYRVGKFVTRNRGGVASATLSFLVISALAVTNAWQASRLERERDAVRLERDKATAVSDFLVDVFEASDPNEARGIDITAGDILASGRRRAKEELADDPSVQAAVMAAIGSVYRNLGDYAAADSILTDRLEQARETWGDQGVEYADALLDLGALRDKQDRFDEAETEIRTALSIYTEKAGPDADATAEAWTTLGGHYLASGRPAEAEAPLLAALRISTATRGDDDEAALGVMNALSVLYGDLQRLDESIDMSRRVVEARRRMHGSDNTALAAALGNLGGGLAKAGRHEEAAQYLSEGLEMSERILPPGHPAILTARNNLAVQLVGLQRYDEAEALLDSIASTARARADVALLGRALVNVGAVASLRGDHEKSAAALREAVEVFRPILGPDHPLLGMVYSGLGYAQHQLGRLDDAEASFEEALRMQRASAAPDPNLAHTLRNYGRLLLESGRISEARPMVEEAKSLYERMYDPSDPQRLSFEVVLAQLRLAQGAPEEARALLEHVVATRSEDDPRTARAVGLLHDQFGDGGA